MYRTLMLKQYEAVMRGAIKAKPYALNMVALAAIFAATFMAVLLAGILVLLRQTSSNNSVK